MVHVTSELSNVKAFPSQLCSKEEETVNIATWGASDFLYVPGTDIISLEIQGGS